MAMLTSRELAVLDIECYRNYFMIRIRDIKTRKTKTFEMYDGKELDVAGLKRFLRAYTIVTFNGIGYDAIVMFAALDGASNEELKDLTDEIIVGRAKWWEVLRNHNIRYPDYFDHIDLIEVAPGVGVSLKLYGGRLNSKKIQDLPIEPDAFISPSDRVDLVTYCGNDLDTTIDLFNAIQDRLDVRAQMTEKYGIDVRSKSDAQIAEVVIKHGLTGGKMGRIEPKRYRAGTKFQYEAPKWVNFKSKKLKALFETVKSMRFEIDGKGYVIMPPELEGLTVKLRDSIYQMGIGGLHSTEANISMYSDEDGDLLTPDVESYYPNLIRTNGWRPEHLDERFNKILSDLIVERLHAKHNMKHEKSLAVVNAILKIVINGMFGKLGSSYSFLYAPKVMIQVTVTGQLGLLMLIEAMELAHIPVLSANTDGIVVKCRPDQRATYDAIIKEWEDATGLVMETDQFTSCHAISVNNYVAFTPNGKVKRKGATFCEPDLQHNPNMTIVTEAVIEYLKNGTPVSKTIMACNDITKFLVVRRVTGGANFVRNYREEKVTQKEMRRQLRLAGWWAVDEKSTIWTNNHNDYCGEYELKDAYAHLRGAAESEYVGKVVRWYYGYDRNTCFLSANKGHTVSNSAGAIPMMELLDEIPADLNYHHYIEAALQILRDVDVEPDEEDEL